MRNLSLGRRHLVSAYEVEASIGVIAGNTVWAMPERLECEVAYYKKSALYKYTYLPTYLPGLLRDGRRFIAWTLLSMQPSSRNIAYKRLGKK